jgi:cytochrome c-type biogenesis protein CcmH/NrfF
VTQLLRRGRRACLAAALAITLLAALAAGPALAAAKPNINFAQLQAQFMCVVCHEPLNVAQSPEAFSESDELRTYIHRGLTVPEIKTRMVQQFGPQVLGKPPAHGFNLLVYVVPPAVIVIGLVTIAVTLPKWRRRTRERAAAEAEAAQSAGTATPGISAADAQRLDEDLARNL